MAPTCKHSVWNVPVKFQPEHLIPKPKNQQSTKMECSKHIPNKFVPTGSQDTLILVTVIISSFTDEKKTTASIVSDFL